MKLFTIGFTQTTAERFFCRIASSGVTKLLDTRLNRDGQLSGFAKSVDLKYFLGRLTSTPYRAEPLLTPTEDMLRRFKKKEITWDEYAGRYQSLLEQRELADKLSPNDLENACLLCSEHRADHCHRRLAAEFLQNTYRDRVQIEIVHL